MDDKLINSLHDLELDFREKRSLRMLRATSHCSAVMTSALFTKCLEIIRAWKCKKPLEDLEKLLMKSVIPKPSCGLPPHSSKLLLTRLEQIYPGLTSEILYTVQLPENHAGYNQRRAGLIIRQHLSHGQIKALFVAGTEQDSPASRALNLRCGDRLLAVAGYPLNWRTLELHRFGLLDGNELQGLQLNANLYDLACHLLNEPYRLDRRPSQQHETRAKPCLVLVDQRKCNGFARLGSTGGSVTGNSQCDKLSEQSKHLAHIADTNGKVGGDSEALYCETVLKATNPNSGLGLQLGFDEQTNGVYIVSILPQSEAEVDGVLHEGDRITEVNYENIEAMDAREALKKIKAICQKTSFVHLKVARPLHDLDDQLEHTADDDHAQPQFLGFCTPDQANIPQRTEERLVSVSSIENIATKTVTAVPDIKVEKAITVDPLMHSVNLNGKYEYQLDFWRSQFAPTVEILVAEYDISQSTCGLGISLEGTMEKEEGELEPVAHHYIVDLTPQGPIHRQGILKSGDELLEVNNHILYGEEHLKVARILHKVRPQGYLICARYQKPEPIRPPELKLKDENEERDQLSGVVSMRMEDTTELNGSDETSDVDQHSTPPKILYAQSIRKCEVVRQDEPGEEPPSSSISTSHETPPKVDKTEGDALPHCNNGVDDTTGSSELPETVNYSRLPMPARFANLYEKIPAQRERLRHRSEAESLSRIDQLSPSLQSTEVTFQPEKNCLSLMLTKSTGEFLGLEIDSEDGGSNGIVLLNVISGSPLDRIRTADRTTPVWGSRSSLPQYSTLSDRQSEQRMLKPGDWITSVAGYSFRYRPNFKARRLLRRLVVSSGTFEIQYIPREWLVDTQTDNSCSWTAEFEEFRRGYNTDSDSSDH